MPLPSSLYINKAGVCDTCLLLVLVILVSCLDLDRSLINLFEAKAILVFPFIPEPSCDILMTTRKGK